MRRTSIRRSLPLILAAVGGAMALVPASNANAQLGQAAQIGRVMNPYYLRRDVRLITDILRLDEGQEDILETLFFDYEDAHADAKTVMEERFRGMKDEMARIDPNDKNAVVALVMRPFAEQTDDWYEAREMFLAAIQSILTDAQLDRWDECMRELRRAKELPQGELAGEKADLFVIVREAGMQSSAGGPLAAVLASYELELDAALKRREQLESANRTAFMESMASPSEASVDMVRDMTAARVAVRDVNLAYATQLAGMLPPAEAQTLMGTFDSMSFASARRKTTAARILERAINIESLDDGDRAAVTEITAEYGIRIATLFNEERAAIVLHEPRIQIDRAEQFVNNETGGIEGELVLAEFRKRRTDLDRATMKTLQGVLTPSEFLSLPGASRFVGRSSALNPDADPSAQKRRETGNPRSKLSGNGSGRGGR